MLSAKYQHHTSPPHFAPNRPTPHDPRHSLPHALRQAPPPCRSTRFCTQSSDTPAPYLADPRRSPPGTPPKHHHHAGPPDFAPNRPTLQHHTSPSRAAPRQAPPPCNSIPFSTKSSDTPSPYLVDPRPSPHALRQTPPPAFELSARPGPAVANPHQPYCPTITPYRLTPPHKTSTFRQTRKIHPLPTNRPKPSSNPNKNENWPA